MNAIAIETDANIEAIARSTDLHALQEIIRKGKTNFLEVGTALWRIREAKLYRATHSSWESWCETHWHASKRHADRQIAATRIAQEMGPRVPDLSERQIRELGQMPPEQRQNVIERAGPGATSVELRAAAVTPPAPGQLGLGMVTTPRRDLSQWDTRPETARWLVDWAVGDWAYMGQILEPSAGLGHIAAAILERKLTPLCVELDMQRAAELKRAGFEVEHSDFLDYSAERGPGDHFSLAIMNPPYEHGQDLAHILAALSVCPTVVVLARLVLLEGQERRARLWDKHTLRRLCVLSERESFEGDVDGTPRSAFAAFEISRGKDGESVVEWRT
jgi:predicted RNA methylase